MARILSLIIVVAAISVVAYPNFWVYVFLLIDFLTPWKVFESGWFEQYHTFIMSLRSEQGETPIPELHWSNYTREAVMKTSNNFLQPFVIRGALRQINTTNPLWTDSEWWLANYPDEKVLCGFVDRSNPDPYCTIKQFFDAKAAGKPFYISGGSYIFDRNPQLREMIEDDVLAREMEPSKDRVATQIFMGFDKQGSDVHAAIGCNLFRQVAGKKKWWFLPPSETFAVWPSINLNGFSCHTHTMIGKQGTDPSPWLKKMKRYTTVLEPGDVLFNPPWYWHAIINEAPNDGSLVIGVPTRYGEGTCARAALLSNPTLTAVAIGKILYEHGSVEAFKKAGLEKDIAGNRAYKKIEDFE